VARTGGRQPHDALTSQVATTARGRIGAVTDTGRLVLLDVVSTTEVPRTEGAPGLAGATQVRQLVDIEPEEKVVGLVPVGSADNPPIVLATAEGVIKRVKPGDEPRNAESWEVISLSEGDRVVFAGTAADTDFLALVTSDAQLLRFQAAKVRPQGRGAGGMAGISLHEGARVIAGAAVPEELLAEAVAVTTRVSLSAPPVEEVKVGTKLLEFMGLRERQLEIVSCPSCGRAQVDVWTLAEEVEAGLKKVTAPLRVAVMGCVVNGPGEAREADLGCASGNGKGQIFVRGQVVETVPEDQVVETLLKHAEAMAAEMAEELGEEALAGTSPMVSAAG